jgi:hypothetical protein
MTQPERVARLYISLDRIEPAIWRRVEVPLTLTLKGLHDVIQTLMGWQGYHLHEFRIGDDRYGSPDPEFDWGRKIRSDKSTRLGALIDKGVMSFAYVYDFGDNWEHTIKVEAVADADPAFEYPRFLAGERRGPPEDVGGLDGYLEFVKAATRPRHREHRQVLEWYGGPYDPNDIDVPRIVAGLDRMARKRTLGKAAYLKSQGRRH